VNLEDGALMTCGDAAKVLGVTGTMVQKLDELGRLKAIRTRGGYRLFWAEDVEALAAERAKAKKAGRRR
jgi:excisionase family DNA binding protein